MTGNLTHLKKLCVIFDAQSLLVFIFCAPESTFVRHTCIGTTWRDPCQRYLLQPCLWIGVSKVSFIILRHCCTHCVRTWVGASSLTKTLISQSALCTFAFTAFMLVMLALCVKCRRTLERTFRSVCTKS